MSDDEPNEIIAAAKEAKARKARLKKPKREGNWPLKAIGLGVGIGSAAVAAALLYVNRDRDDD